MSRVDEAVLKRYQDTVQLVTLENRESHLQFRLPWAHDPATMKENYQQAKNLLLKLRGKLEGQPELAVKYSEKIETAIDKGHIVRVPDKVLQKEEKNPSKPRYYIPHFNTSQLKFRVVYDVDIAKWTSEAWSNLYAVIEIHPYMFRREDAWHCWGHC